MKKNELTTVKNLDISQLKEKAKALKKEIADLTLDKNMKKLKDLKMISKKRKEAAQFLTIIKQKELLAKLESKSKKETGASLSERKE